MKIVAIVTLLMSLFSLFQTEGISFPLEDNQIYQKYYRELIKIQNLKRIEQFNKNQFNKFTLSANKFVNLKNDEFHSMYHSTTQNNSKYSNIQIPNLNDKGKTNTTNAIAGVLLSPSKTLDISVDFSNKTYFDINVDLTSQASPVKDQGACNSCYAHAAIATVETLLHQKQGIIYDLSEQQILECTLNWAPMGQKIYNNKGCNGGWGWISYHYMKYRGVTYEENYPYISKNTKKLDICNQSSIKSQRFKISDYKTYTNEAEPQSQCNILHQVLLLGRTLSVSIYAPKGHEYQFYGAADNGIDVFDFCDSYDSVNHEVQLVGVTNQYWKIKNSYGVQWGEKGYLYLDKTQGWNCLNICRDFAYAEGIATLQ